MPNSPANRSDGPTRSRVRSRVVRRILGALIAIGLVAALVLQHNLALYSRDGHFDHLPQLTRL